MCAKVETIAVTVVVIAPQVIVPAMAVATTGHATDVRADMSVDMAINALVDTWAGAATGILCSVRVLPTPGAVLAALGVAMAGSEFGPSVSCVE